MTDLIKQYIAARDEASSLRNRAMNLESSVEKAAEAAPLPDSLRPATKEDIVVGAVIWYPRWHKEDPSGRCWNIVDQVLFPSDAFKAYCAHEGCRYGLDGAFVEL